MGSGEGSLPGGQRPASRCVLTWQKEGERALRGLCHKGSNPIPESALIASPGPHLLIPSHWAAKFQHRSLGEGGVQSFTLTILYLFFMSPLYCAPPSI